MFDENRFLTTADMAKIYGVATAERFRIRFKRDQKRPPELREFPDEYRPGTLLWAPGVVQALLRGEEFQKRRRG